MPNTSRTLNVLNETNREALAIEVGQPSIPAMPLVRVLEQLIALNVNLVPEADDLSAGISALVPADVVDVVAKTQECHRAVRSGHPRCRLGTRTTHSAWLSGSCSTRLACATSRFPRHVPASRTAVPTGRPGLVTSPRT